MTEKTTSIHKAGIVQIRGLFRRVWRVRYLEIQKDGIVRYYEPLDPRSITVSPSIQATSSSSDDDSDENSWDDLSLLSTHTKEKQQHPPPSKFRLKVVMTVHDARLLDANSNHRDSNISLPSSTHGFLFYGSPFYSDKSQHSNRDNPLTTLSASRDYLCVVSSKEEAMEWVKALQWAAASGPKVLPSPEHFSKNCMGIGLFPPLPSRDYDDDSKISYSNSSAPIARRVVRSSSLYDDHGGNRPPSSNGSRPNPQKNSGTVVVTKVRAFYPILHKPIHFFFLEMEYEIRMLLLQKTSLQEEHSLMEELSIRRTCADFLALIQGLKQECGDSAALLDTAHLKLMEIYNNDSLLSYLLIHKRMLYTISRLDSVLRLLTTNATYCNSKSMKLFLKLDSLKNKKRDIPAKTTDEFVKRWLWKDERDIISVQVWMKLMVCYYRWLILLSVYFLVLEMVYRDVMVPVVTVREDWIAVGFLISFYVGYWTASVRSQRSIMDKTERIAAPSEEEEETTTTPAQDQSQPPIQDTTPPPQPKPKQDDAHPFTLSSPLPMWPTNAAKSCWSRPLDEVFRVRGQNYLNDRIKIRSSPSPFSCRGVDVFMTPDPLFHIARHPSMLGGCLREKDTFMVNFLLPFCNFVAYFAMDESKMSEKHREVWMKFKNGDQQYRDARLKMLPLVVDGPWIVRKAVGPGNAPAVLAKVIPLQYYRTEPTPNERGYFEVDVIITASKVAKAILKVVKGHTDYFTIAFAFIIEGVNVEQLPETVLASFQMHELNLSRCPELPGWVNPDEFPDDD